MTMKAAFSDREVFFNESEVIVSKTDTKGALTYVNKVFIRVSEYKESELIGQPHSMIRHPDMPRCIFKLLWDTIGSGQEIFAYVKNATKSGAYYWVLAHVTPSRDTSGQVVGFHSNRRVPNPDTVKRVNDLYRELRSIEQQGDRRQGLERSYQHLISFVQKQNKPYDEIVHSL